MKELIEKTKKFIKKIGDEEFWGGVFGIVAIAAAIVALVLGEIDASSVWDCVKDVAGTLVVVMVLFSNIPKFAKDFKAAFINAMEEIIEKYNPLISTAEITDKKSIEENHDKIRYTIANNTNCIFNEKTEEYNKFFDFDFTNNSIQFYVSEGIFITSKKVQIIDIEDIKSKFIQKLMVYSKIANAASNSDGIKVSFKEPLSKRKDVDTVKQMIDDMVFYYIAQSKKGEKINKNAD